MFTLHDVWSPSTSHLNSAPSSRSAFLIFKIHRFSRREISYLPGVYCNATAIIKLTQWRLLSFIHSINHSLHTFKNSTQTWVQACMHRCWDSLRGFANNYNITITVILWTALHLQVCCHSCYSAIFPARCNAELGIAMLCRLSVRPSLRL